MCRLHLLGMEASQENKTAMNWWLQFSRQTASHMLSYPVRQSVETADFWLTLLSYGQTRILPERPHPGNIKRDSLPGKSVRRTSTYTGAKIGSLGLNKIQCLKIKGCFPRITSHRKMKRRRL